MEVVLTPEEANKAMDKIVQDVLGQIPLNRKTGNGYRNEPIGLTWELY